MGERGAGTNCACSFVPLAAGRSQGQARTSTAAKRCTVNYCLHPYRAFHPQSSGSHKRPRAAFHPNGKNFFRVLPHPSHGRVAFFHEKSVGLRKGRMGGFQKGAREPWVLLPLFGGMQSAACAAKGSFRESAPPFMQTQRKGTHFRECLRFWWKLQGSKPAPPARASPRFAI